MSGANDRKCDWQAWSREIWLRFRSSQPKPIDLEPWAYPFNPLPGNWGKRDTIPLSDVIGVMLRYRASRPNRHKEYVFENTYNTGPIVNPRVISQAISLTGSLTTRWAMFAARRITRKRKVKSNAGTKRWRTGYCWRITFYPAILKNRSRRSSITTTISDPMRAWKTWRQPTFTLGVGSQC